VNLAGKEADMAAFDRVMSGIPQIDENFENIRVIDNYPPYDKLDGAICMAIEL